MGFNLKNKVGFSSSRRLGTCLMIEVSVERVLGKVSMSRSSKSKCGLTEDLST